MVLDNFHPGMKAKILIQGEWVEGIIGRLWSAGGPTTVLRIDPQIMICITEGNQHLFILEELN